MKANLLTRALLLTFSFFYGTTSAQNVILTLKPNANDGKDAYLSSFGPTSNYGTHPELSGDAWTCNSLPCFARGLLQFDLSSIPIGSLINSASLSLYANPTPLNGGGISMQGLNDAILQRVVAAWDENTITWDIQPSAVNQNQVQLPQSSTPFEDYLGIDVKLLVQDMINDPTNSHGFLLRLIDEVYYASLIFASSDFADSSKWPEITIDYTPPQSTCVTFYLNQDNGKDAYLSSFDPTLNFGSHLELSGDAWTCNSLPCYGRGLFYFDISQIPQNAILQSANLSLFANPTPVNGNGVAMQGFNESEILRVTSAWNENTVTWSTAPTFNMANGFLLHESSAPYEDYINNDIAPMVQDMVSNPASIYGFMI